jgi:aprataxin
MPLVVTALDAALDLPAPAAGDAEPPPTVLGRALKRVGAVADADARNVSRAQIEVRLVSDRVGPGCVVTAVGENPTPWFPNDSRFRDAPAAAAGAKRLLRKGESAVLRDGDGLGLCQSDAPPGALRFQSAGASTTLAPEALLGDQTAKRKTHDEGGRTHPFKRAKGSSADVNEALTHTTHTTTETGTPRRERPVALVMSGAPGAGKSSFCATLPKDDWAVVNQDTAGRGGKQGTRAQCVEAMRRALLITKKNVAIDRCGLTPEQRETFVSIAAECDAEAHALFLDPPRDALFERLRKRTGHPTIADGGGVGVCKRMLGAKANAPPSKKEGFARVTRCVNDWDVEQARSYYRRPRGRVVVGENRKSKIDAAPRTADRDANPNASANPPNAPNAPNAFAQMMGAARASAGSSAKKTKTSGGASPPPSVSKTAAVNRGGWRDALSAMAADPAAFQKRGAVLFFDDELVVARDAYPKSRTHLLVLARDTRLTEGPKAMRSTDAALVRRMARVGEAHARTLAASSPPRESAAAAAADDDDAERFRFRCGFHASPSMRTAHMHVVSGDLRGVGMKTRRHWNSFATSFFKEAEETARDLERAEAESISGDASSGTRWDVAELERVVAMTPLRCHKCGDGPFPTMPKLFAHTDACVRVGFSTRTDAL